MENVKALIQKPGRTRKSTLILDGTTSTKCSRIRVAGTVEKQAVRLVAPTTSVPLILTLAPVLGKGRGHQGARIECWGGDHQAMTEGTERNRASPGPARRGTRPGTRTSEVALPVNHRGVTQANWRWRAHPSGSVAPRALKSWIWAGDRRQRPPEIGTSAAAPTQR